MAGNFSFTTSSWETFSTTALVAINSYSSLLCSAPPRSARRQYLMRRMKQLQSVPRTSLCTVAEGH